MSDQLKQDVLTVLEKHPLCVMSTVTAEGLPQAAIVGFVQSEDLKLLIGTSNRTRKYANLQHNQHVAIALGDFDAEVQYEGTVRELSKDERTQYLETDFENLPGSAKYLEEATQVYFLVSPSWIRLTVHGDQNTVSELKDFV